MEGKHTTNRETTGKDINWILSTKVTEENITTLIDCLEIMRKVHQDRAKRAMEILKNKHVRKKRRKQNKKIIKNSHYSCFLPACPEFRKGFKPL